MCVGENTYQPANVRAVRLSRTASALQQAAAPFVKEVKDFFDKLKRRKVREAFLLFHAVDTNIRRGNTKLREFLCKLSFCVDN